MKPTVINRTSTIVTLDSLPTDVQAGDKVQIVSPTGKVRGKSKWAKPMEYSPLLALAVFTVWYILNLGSIRYVWLLGLSVVLLILTTMAMMVAMEEK